VYTGCLSIEVPNICDLKFCQTKRYVAKSNGGRGGWKVT